MTETTKSKILARLQALEAVAEAARAWGQIDTDYMPYEEANMRAQALKKAIRALPADPAPAEKVGAKTVQITAIPAGDGLVACVFALRDDGSIWGKRVDGGNWWRESDIPTVEASCLPLVKGDGA
jgi:hypothetical protein